MAVVTEVAAIPELALADSDINRASLVPLSSNVRVAASSGCQRLHDLSILVSFLVNMLAVLFTIQQGLLHPTAMKTRMQAADSGLSHMLRNDGIPGLSRGFGTSAIGAFPGEVLSLTAFEVSKDMMLTYTEVSAMAGTVADACSSIITTHVDNIKTWLQATKTLLEEDGWWGFNRGFGSCFLNMSLYETTMIVTNELIKLKSTVICPLHIFLRSYCRIIDFLVLDCKKHYLQFPLSSPLSCFETGKELFMYGLDSGIVSVVSFSLNICN
ncbi:hypothetical protein D5086_020243 [Populus alba]|uniref:Uncharacterized protein n=1 Tax=Populus alba TaxID=43335 RepID=A0ACC4BKZ1_POPAL